ncbi:MAG: outer membrane protein assembly factor BamB, partial [Planctomycetota bacterium]
RKINRSLSTMAIGGGLVVAADFSGFVYCLDALTGEEYWVHDTKGHIWSSPLIADGRVYIGNEDGFLTIIPATKTYDKKSVVEVDMISPIYSSAVAANGTIYITTTSHLFAVANPESGR